jgi:hypothetical protein
MALNKSQKYCNSNVVDNYISVRKKEEKIRGIEDCNKPSTLRCFVPDVLVSHLHMVPESLFPNTVWPRKLHQDSSRRDGRQLDILPEPFHTAQFFSLRTIGHLHTDPDVK